MEVDGSDSPLLPADTGCSCVDHETGLFSLEYDAPKRTGRYTLEVWINGALGVRRSVAYGPAAPSASMMLHVLSEPSGRAEAGAPLWLSVQPHDGYGNRCPLPPDQLAAELTGPGQAAVVVVQEAAEPLGPLRVLLSRELAGEYALRLAVRSGRAAQPERGHEDQTESVPGATCFVIYPAATSPAHCHLVERDGEYALCASAVPPRRFLTLRQAGYSFTVNICDRFGNISARDADSCVATARPSASVNASNAALRAAQHKSWGSLLWKKGDVVTTEDDVDDDKARAALDASTRTPPARVAIGGAILGGESASASSVPPPRDCHGSALPEESLLTLELEASPRGDGSFEVRVPGVWPELPLALALDPSAVAAARRPAAGTPLSGAFWLRVVINGNEAAEVCELIHLGNPALGLSRTFFGERDGQCEAWQTAWAGAWQTASATLAQEHSAVDGRSARSVLEPYAEQLQALFAARCDPTLMAHLTDGLAAGRAAELSMSNFQWWAFCKTCRLPHQPDLSQWQLDELLPGGRGPGHGVDLAAFLHSLPLIAARKFPSEDLERALERLVREHLLPFMPVPETELMQCARQVMARHEPELLSCYAEWANSDSRDEFNKLLSCKELTDMLRAAKLVGRELTIMQVRLALLATLFEPPPRSWQHRYERMHLGFAEFTEVLTRCAEVRFKTLDPSPVVRIETFISSLLGASFAAGKNRKAPIGRVHSGLGGPSEGGP